MFFRRKPVFYLLELRQELNYRDASTCSLVAGISSSRSGLVPESIAGRGVGFSTTRDAPRPAAVFLVQLIAREN
jgi:hypothetical protein